MAAKQLKSVKIWVDDRRGTYPKMTPEVYNAIIAEAHAHGMMVNAHAIALPDQKAVVSAGVDVLVHTVGNEKLDAEYVAIVQVEETVLDHRDWTGRSQRGLQSRCVRRSDVSAAGARGDPR